MANATVAPIFSEFNKQALIDVALGREKADLAVVNARLVNVYTREILSPLTVVVKGEWIAYVGEDGTNSIGKQTTVIDAQGQTLIPGLIDGHTHLAWMYSTAAFLEYAMTGGTTTIISETMEAYAVMGLQGVAEFLQTCANQPIKILSTAPAMGSISRASLGVDADHLAELLSRPDIVGLGESYWQTVLQEPQALLPAFEETLARGKLLEGHSAGARGNNLNAYAAAGVTSCHEPIREQEVVDRLRLGMCVQVREGSVRRELEEIAKIKDAGIDFRRLTLVSDGIQPPDLLDKGAMEYIVQKAIDSGFDPVTAIQMATLNAADHFGLSSYIGGVAPGRHADFLLIPDPRTIDARYVVSRGKIIAQDGRLLVSPRAHDYSAASRRSISLKDDLQPTDFAIHAAIDAPVCKVRLIELISELVTVETIMQWPVENGEIRSSVDQDVVKVAAIDRYHRPGKMFVGLLKGMGLRSGAMASSCAWDTSDIVVAGAGDADMALAVNRVRALQGGAVVCSDGRVLAEMPLPVMGLISELPVPELARQLNAVNDSAKALGVPYADPLLTLMTLTGAAIPFLRLCEEGLVNLKTGRQVELFVP